MVSQRASGLRGFASLAGHLGFHFYDAAPMKCVLAADLGGTKCRVALVTEDRRVLNAQRIPTSRDRSVFLPALEGAIAAAQKDMPSGVEAPSAIGIGTAGVISADGQTIEIAPNLPLDAFPMVQHMRTRFGLSAALLNDGRASALGEYIQGEAVGSDPLLCLFFGTGIGIGVIVHGMPHEGADNAAGEIGHTIYVPEGRRCPCGGLGHFEAYCGGRAIQERLAAALGPAPDGGMWSRKAVEAMGSAPALAVFEDAALAAAVATANACTLFNPRAVVIGGGLVDVWPELRTRIESFVRRECSKAITRNLRFCGSQGGSDAILLGAAAATRALWASSKR